jgi:hypothetical protein
VPFFIKTEPYTREIEAPDGEKWLNGDQAAITAMSLSGAEEPCHRHDAWRRSAFDCLRRQPAVSRT